MFHTIILHQDGEREFRKGYNVRDTDKAETLSHPYLNDFQVKEIMEASKERV